MRRFNLLLATLAVHAGLASCTPSAESLRHHVDEAAYIYDEGIRLATIQACTTSDPTGRAEYEALPACRRAREIDEAIRHGWKPTH